MYFTQNLLKNWIFGGNLVVDKTLRKLRKATTSRDNDICCNCYLLLVEQGKSCNTVTVSRSARAKTEQIICTIKKQRGKRVAYHLVLCHCSDVSLHYQAEKR